jgi:hypothetical protein
MGAFPDGRDPPLAVPPRTRELEFLGEPPRPRASFEGPPEFSGFPSVLRPGMARRAARVPAPLPALGVGGLREVGQGHVRPLQGPNEPSGRHGSAARRRKPRVQDRDWFSVF